MNLNSPYTAMAFAAFVEGLNMPARRHIRPRHATGTGFAGRTARVRDARDTPWVVPAMFPAPMYFIFFAGS